MSKSAEIISSDIVLVRTSYVPGRYAHNMTAGKIYTCDMNTSKGGTITLDDGRMCYILLMGCAYIDDHNWEILPRKFTKYYLRFGRLPPKELEEFCQG